MLDIPIGAISIVNATLLLFGWYLEFIVFGRHSGRYPPAVLLVGVFLLSYGPYYLVTRGETLFERDPGGNRSRAVWYAVAYILVVLAIIADVSLVQQWLAASG